MKTDIVGRLNKMSIKKKVAIPIIRKIGTLCYKLYPDKTAFRKFVFSGIYNTCWWSREESLSGAGSNLAQTEVIAREIPKLAQELGIKVLLDAPCGDFYWMRHLKLNIDKYIGVDIVSEIIKKNQEKYGRENREFMLKDIISDSLPEAHMILCRDCLVHFSYNDIFHTIKNIKKSRSTFLLTTTFTGWAENKNILTGEWRPLNLQLAPFNFPEPVKIINEKCSEFEGIYADKSLALWKIEDLPG